MKPFVVIALAVSSLTLELVQARPTHADINYERYLAEIDTADADYQSWKSNKFFQIATKNNWLPEQSEERSADDNDEDMRQRIFMSKRVAQEAQAANPNANFSIMTPFSALTNKEFTTKVTNPYVLGNKTNVSSTAPKRSLRQEGGYSFSSIQNMINSIAQGQQGTISGDDSDWNFAPTTASSSAAATISTTSPTRTPTEESATTETSASTTGTQTGSVDWSDTACISPIQNQGQCGGCWAFATVAAVESLQCISNGKASVKKYSEQQLLGCDSQNQGCGGGAPVYAYEYIQQNGLCGESAVPYEMENGGTASCGSTCSQSDPGLTGYENLEAGDD
ncbi:hypothetical protein V7S43_012559 [Phytophthora oleae]|uniref:Peptidase C1A papain C-terminal domain-containing protein n=1 Tax=Phytophthora oleae TaxID=2107226 RepID=A0ABD3F672_9STRA